MNKYHWIVLAYMLALSYILGINKGYDSIPTQSRIITHHTVEYIEDPIVTAERVAGRIALDALDRGIDVTTALRIARAESDFRALAVNTNTNGSNDKGVYQINSIHNVPDTCRLDYRCNIAWALDTMTKKGTQPWYSSKHRWAYD